MSDWQPISTHPGNRQFLATLRVYSASTGAFSHWDTHVIAIDEDTGDVIDDQGWDIGDYEFWAEIPRHPQIVLGEDVRAAHAPRAEGEK